METKIHRILLIIIVYRFKTRLGTLSTCYWCQLLSYYIVNIQQFSQRSENISRELCKKWFKYFFENVHQHQVLGKSFAFCRS